MDYWVGQGVGRFILSVGYRRQAIMEHFGDAWQGIPLDYVVEEALLGTGGGLLAAASGIDGPFLLLNGDTFFAVDLGALRDFHATNQSEWTFGLFRTDETGRYMGMRLADDGRIRALQSGTGQLANGGAYLVEPDVLAGLEWRAGQACSLENDILPALMQQQRRLYGLEQAGLFIDIGVPQDYRRAADLLP